MSGLPIASPQPRNTAHVMLATALRMLECCAGHAGLDDIRIAVGMHSGRCIEAVLGAMRGVL